MYENIVSLKGSMMNSTFSPKDIIVCRKVTVANKKVAHTVDSTSIQDVVNAVLNMQIATPADLIPIIESVAKTLGKIMNAMLSEDENTAPLSSNSTNDTSGGDSDIIKDANDDMQCI